MKNTEKQVREPLFHIVKRNVISRKMYVLIYACAIFGGLLISSIICSILSGRNPVAYFGAMFNGAFGTSRKIWILLQDTALLLGVALALAPAFRMKFWNLGGNGQILVGNLAAVACIWYLGGKIPDGLLLVLMFVAALAAGAIWAVIPALFKAFFDTNESLFTLMMNYIAKGLVSVFITIWVKTGSGVLANNFKDNGYLPDIGNQYLTVVIPFLLLTGAMFAYMRYSKQGYEISVVGESRNTAKYIGIDVKSVVIRTLIISGALCGLVGFFLAGSVSRTVAPSSDSNMGFTAIMVAWLANFNPLIMMLSAFFITFVSKGMVQVRKDFGFTTDASANIVIGIIYFCVIACAFFVNYKVIFRQKAQAESPQQTPAGEEKEKEEKA